MCARCSRRSSNDVGPHEAYARLRAAEQLAAEGRRAEADDQLARAVAFFREARATRWLRQAEALGSTASAR
jgi:hypothetical protein